ncbi:MAG TPA: hypothetical protein VGN82_03585 [Bosea sp. (in: a-proteobacteria)]|uniref:hypothetical protein n=1 Tax=Bosea sp. (in: a-proteobacteria) TaxID=1871050 RepID=UPI002E0F43AF|nr:hypothetical protein [Bosea sp. (in: a-proteobacteria)]
MQDQLVCPYCDAVLNGSALSCRCCGRDLTPVLPLLRRLNAAEARLASLDALEVRLVSLEQASERRRFKAEAVEATEASAAAEAETAVEPPGTFQAAFSRRRFWVLPIGFAVLLAAYWTVVLGLDLSLSVLRFASMAIPFATGLAYFGVRPRLSWLDASIAVVFALFSVGAMNALLGWIDNIPLLPQGVAAWRETSFYALSIGASMFAGMLLRVTQAALSAKGLASVPALRSALLSMNGKMPMDTLKAIEMTILMASTALTIMTGLIAGLLGVK